LIAAAALLVLAGASPAPAIRWERRFDEALRKAKAAHKPLMVDFWAEWCGWCHRLDRTTYTDARVIRMADDFIAVKLNTEGSAQEAAIAERYEVSSLPTITFLSPSGRQILRVQGFQGPGQFPGTMETAREMGAKVMTWEDSLEKSPTAADALMGLGVHLFEQEDYPGSRELLRKAVKSDTDLPALERKRARMLLAIIMNYDRKHAEAESLLKEALGLHPTSEYDPKLLYLLGKTYVSWGKPKDARDTFQRVMDDYPQSYVAQKAREALASLDHRR
jgi:thioredoxin-like negative regulator of GroEL